MFHWKLYNNFWIKWLLVHLTVVFGLQSDTYDYSFQKKYYFDLQPLNWPDAMKSCQSINGSLAAVYDASTMVELNITIQNKFWIGLSFNTSDVQYQPKWLTGNGVIYTNWQLQKAVNGEMCTAVENLNPYWWSLENCSLSLPYICEVDTDYPCDFMETTSSSLTSLNSEYLLDQNFTDCLTLCNLNHHFVCRSFGYNSKRKFCQFSPSNRWLSPGYFTSNDFEWDYYNKQCLHGRVIGEKWNRTSEEIPPKYIIQDNYICRPVVDIMVLVNQSKQPNEDVQILQDMGKQYKDKSKTLSRTSQPDDRPSAAVVGYTTVTIVVVLLSLIVLIDILTFLRHCETCYSFKNNGRKIPSKNSGKMPRPLSVRLMTSSQQINSFQINDRVQPNNIMETFTILKNQQKVSQFEKYSVYLPSDSKNYLFRSLFFRSQNLPNFISARPPTPGGDT